MGLNAHNNRKESEARRAAVSPSVIAVMAVIVLAVGMTGGLLLTWRPVPDSLQPVSTDNRTVAAVQDTYDDARTVDITVHTGASQTIAATGSGMITATSCEPGAVVASGTAPLSIDETPQLALHTAVPTYRDLQSGMRGGDAQSLNDELRRLGYAAPVGDTMTWDTILAYNTLAYSVGAEPLTAENGWELPVGSYLWLSEVTVTVTSCPAAVGTTVNPGDGLIVTTATPGYAEAVIPDAGSFPGSRSLQIDGTAYPLVAPDGGGIMTITDTNLISAITSSSTYAQLLSERGGPEGMGADGGDITVSLPWTLDETATVWDVPPSALYDLEQADGCVVSDGEPVAVTVVASGLGRTKVVTQSAKSLGDVLVEGKGHPSCR